MKEAGEMCRCKAVEMMPQNVARTRSFIVSILGQCPLINGFRPSQCTRFQQPIETHELDYSSFSTVPWGKTWGLGFRIWGYASQFVGCFP